MLKKLVAIKGIGLFHDAPASPAFAKATLIYGENGRGKSTLACILRSCSEADPSPILERKTLDGTNAPHVQAHAEILGKNVTLAFTSGNWSQLHPSLDVFDGEFVRRNVHSGHEIGAEQRSRLLDFALGEDAVAANAAVDEAAEALAEATQEVTNTQKIVATHAGAKPIPSFIAIPVNANAAAEIEALNNRIVQAKNRDAVLKRPLPTPLSTFAFNLESLLTLLAETLADVEASAESTVKQHLSKLPHGVESWVSQGMTFTKGPNCPFCDQDVTNNNLVNAYRTHFNAAYTELKHKAAQISSGLEKRLSGDIVKQAELEHKSASDNSKAWDDVAKGTEINDDIKTVAQVFTALLTILKPMGERKAVTPLDAVGTKDDYEKIRSLWNSAQNCVAAINESIDKRRSEIEAYKQKLQAEDETVLLRQIEDRRLCIKRHTAPVVEAVAAFQKANSLRELRSKEKEAARAALSKVMAATLTNFESDINELLNDFGAGIRIRKLAHDFKGGGGTARTDYTLELRGKAVPLGGKTGVRFENALSEGDKRALGLAFFMARLKRASEIEKRVILVDDPMCSLDRSRRAATLRHLRVLSGKCSQIIVLAHDPFFLRDLRDQLKKDGCSIATLSIERVANDYSVISAVEFDTLAASDYYRDFGLVRDFESGAKGLDIRSVAKAIRPMLEGYLHRRFPGQIDRGRLFGDIVGQIRTSVAPSPLIHMQPLVDRLQEVNDYAGKFHHIADGKADIVAVDEGELLTYCRKALDIVYRGNAP